MKNLKPDCVFANIKKQTLLFSYIAITFISITLAIALFLPDYEAYLAN